MQHSAGSPSSIPPGPPLTGWCQLTCRVGLPISVSPSGTPLQACPEVCLWTILDLVRLTLSTSHHHFPSSMCHQGLRSQAASAQIPALLSLDSWAMTWVCTIQSPHWKEAECWTICPGASVKHSSVVSLQTMMV